jgi:hypothetical protein
MKKAIKIIIAAAVFLCLSLGGVMCCSADVVVTDSAEVCQEPLADAATLEMGEAYLNENDEADITPDENDGENTVKENESNQDDGLTENEGDATDNKNGDTAENNEKGAESGFEQVYNTVLTHISEILSLFAFIGSLICAVIYKSGLMPLMEKGLTGLKNAAVKIKEATDRAESDNKESINGISGRIAELEEAVSDMSEAFVGLREALSGLEDQKAHQMKLDTILGGELDMLYDIFMTSSLPEYEKARVGERMGKLKEVLSEGEGKK